MASAPKSVRSRAAWREELRRRARERHERIEARLRRGETVPDIARAERCSAGLVFTVRGASGIRPVIKKLGRGKRYERARERRELIEEGLRKGLSVRAIAEAARCTTVWIYRLRARGTTP